MPKFGDASAIRFNGNSATKAFFNGNQIWPITTNEYVSSGLVLYFDPSNASSYPGSGTTITDLSGNSRNGTMSNITFSSPYFSFNGTNSQVAISDNALLEPGSGDWTVEVWTSQKVAGNDVVLGKFDPGGTSQDVAYSVRTTSNSYYAQYGSGAGSGATLYQNSTSYSKTLNTWHQLVYVFTNVAANTFETFVNGSSIGSVGHSLASILNTTANLYLGSYNNGEYAQWFDGKIGIVRIYNKALTSSEVLQNFNADKSKYESSVITNGLQLYLNAGNSSSYNGSGTTWTDLSSNAYLTTLTNTPTYNSAHGGYFSFDGSDYVDTNQSLASETFSVGGWFKTTAAGIKMFLSKETSAGNPWNYRIWLNGGTINADMSQVTTQASLSSPLSTYNDGNWYYVMFTRNDSNWYLYVNGVQVNTRTDPYSGNTTNSQELWIGRSAYLGGSYQFVGDIGEVMIYNRVLSSSEILQNYNTTKTRFGL